MKMIHKMKAILVLIKITLSDIRHVLSSRGGESDVETVLEILNAYSQIFIDGKLYIVERHFTGHRNLREAVFTAVENEAAREGLSEKST